MQLTTRDREFPLMQELLLEIEFLLMLVITQEIEFLHIQQTILEL
jgi:hypothetical protein